MASAASQHASYLDVATEAARGAGALARSRVAGDTDYALKGSRHDLVTEVDHLAEARIVQHISTAFPDHGVLSEEREPHQLDARFRWVIDPIDGTSNFAHGIPFFSVSIALEDEGELALGALYDPMRDELFTAEAGRGAYLNGRPIRASAVDRPERAVLATGFPHDPELRRANMRNFERFVPLAQGLRRLGSAALALAYVAAGRIDGYWDLDLSRWDLAAGTLLVHEAGGQVTNSRGGPLATDEGDVIAANGHLNEAILTHLQGG
ncbi:MAG: inositol monophosphatase [Candidatus Bipolaricaulia bacterium]